MIRILFSASVEKWAEYEAPLNAALSKAGLTFDLRTDHAADTVDYIVFAPDGPVSDFGPFTRCKAVLGLWAGVETIVGNQTLTQPLARMVGGGLTEGMVEWVTGHVLRHHLGMDAHTNNPGHTWVHAAPPLASERVVTVLGIGALGSACARQLASIGFQVRGWSRRLKEIGGITCYSGDDGLRLALSGANYVVLLLPNTPDTENLMNAEAFAWMAPQSFVINPGRGPLIDDVALIEALDNGQIAHATLDVFRVEPLPLDHPFWAHPQVTVTPHVASETRVAPASAVIADNIRRSEQGQHLLHLVDRSAGY